MTLYMAVTADEYELPLAVEDSPKKLSCATGYSCSLICSCVSRRSSGKTRGIKFVKVVIDEAVKKRP